MAGGQLAVAEYLVEGDADGVLGLLVDAQGAGPQVGLGPSQELVDLGVGGVVDADAHGLAVLVLVGGAAHVDRWGVAGRPGQEALHCAVDAVHADVGGDAVGHLVPLPVAVDRVGEHVDEAGGHDQAAGVQRPTAGEGSVGDGGHGVAVDADVRHAVEPAVGVDDPPALHHQVVEVVVDGGGRCRFGPRRGIGRPGGRGPWSGGGRGRRGRRSGGCATAGEATPEGDQPGAEAEPEEDPSSAHRFGSEVVVGPVHGSGR